MNPTHPPLGEGSDPITLERHYPATLEEVWALWTTPEGIEAWWGPDGFAVTVRELDLRSGGTLRYDMTATAPETVAFMKAQGMPTTTAARLRYTEVLPPRRLAWLHRVDFVPGVEPYEVASTLELVPQAGGVRLVLTLARMHDPVWTGRAVAGWENELGKLARALRARSGAGARP